MKKTKKIELIRTLIELSIYCGYSIDNFIGLPISMYDMDKVKELIKKYIREKADMNGETYEEQFQYYEHLEL